MAIDESVPNRARAETRLVRALGHVGRSFAELLGEVGHAALFLVLSTTRLARRPLRWASFVEQLYFIGNRSLVIIALTSAFTGLVLALQGFNALSRFGAEKMVGALVALSLTRELAPVLGALMVTARAGSAMTATLGNMRVTEQIDALETLAIDPVDFLVKPRLLASLVATPLLTALFTIVGISVAERFTEGALGMAAGSFGSSVRQSVTWSDIREGLVKAFVFAIVLAWISTYRGFYASGGASGVGQATTRAVVEASVLVLAIDYALTALLF